LGAFQPLAEKKLLSQKESHLECLVNKKWILRRIFFGKKSMKPTRESQALVVLKFAANVSTFDRLILAEEIRTCATTKPNPELTPTNPSTSTTDSLVIHRGTGIRSGRVGIFGRNDRCKKLFGRRSQE